MKEVFKNIAIGEKFHLGKHNAGVPREGLSWCELEKISPSRAKCVKQINYGNNRMVGKDNPYAPNTVLFKLED